MYTTFYIVRHGQTDWNVKDLLQGQANPPLNHTGRKQAHEIAETLKTIHFDEIFSSDLDRAVETTEIIAKERNLAVKTATALREKSYGSYEGRFRQEVKEELKELFDTWKKLTTDDEKMKFKIYKNGESDGEAAERFIRHLREIAIAYPGKTILIASHGGVMRYLLIKLGWAKYNEMESHAIQNTGYIKVKTDGIDFFIKETHHIDKKVI